MIRKTRPLRLKGSQGEWEAAKALTDEYAATLRLPGGWREVEVGPGNPAYGARAYQSGDGKVVLLSVARWEDGKRWLHVSLVVPNRLPFYAELCDLKEVFVGAERQALQVFPRRSRHVNIHERCLHLWACLEAEGDGLPEFGSGCMI